MYYLDSVMPPLWWVTTKFGTLVISMFFLSWALVIMWLFLKIIVLVDDLFGRMSKKKKKKSGSPKETA